MAELTINVQLSTVALKLRALRMQSGIDIVTISKSCGIAKEDILAYEMDKKKPTRRQMKALEQFYLNN